MIADYPIFGSDCILRYSKSSMIWGLQTPVSVLVISSVNQCKVLPCFGIRIGGDGAIYFYTDQIAQVFVMIYLQDTAKNNGCLRVLPGSHRKIHGLHENEKAHTEGVSKVENPKIPYIKVSKVKEKFQSILVM